MIVLFDSDRCKPETGYSPLSLEDFDLYVKLLYTYAEAVRGLAFGENIELFSNRIEKDLRIRLVNPTSDPLSIFHYRVYLNQNLKTIETFMKMLNLHYKLYEKPPDFDSDGLKQVFIMLFNDSFLRQFSDFDPYRKMFTDPDPRLGNFNIELDSSDIYGFPR